MKIDAKVTNYEQSATSDVYKKNKLGLFQECKVKGYFNIQKNVTALIIIGRKIK